jgi:hypothetical protein
MGTTENSPGRQSWVCEDEMVLESREGLPKITQAEVPGSFAALVEDAILG